MSDLLAQHAKSVRRRSTTAWYERSRLHSLKRTDSEQSSAHLRPAGSVGGVDCDPMLRREQAASDNVTQKQAVKLAECRRYLRLGGRGALRSTVVPFWLRNIYPESKRPKTAESCVGTVPAPASLRVCPAAASHQLSLI